MGPSKKTSAPADHSSMDQECASGGRESLRIEGDRGKQISFQWEGAPIKAFEGETIAAALMGSGIRALRVTERKGEPRGLFCNMGICFDCLVEVNGSPNQRACQYPVAEGIDVKSQVSESPLEQQK